MMKAVSPEHKARFVQIKSSLSQLGCQESAFTQVELCFYETLAIARSYGDAEDQNGLLAALKQLQTGTYTHALKKFAKAAQRTKVIRQFVNELKVILTRAGRNFFVEQDALQQQ